MEPRSNHALARKMVQDALDRYTDPIRSEVLEGDAQLIVMGAILEDVSSFQVVGKQLGELTGHTASSDGAFTLSVKNKRVKFSGSASIPWLAAFFGTGSGGIGWLVGRALGQW